MILLKSFAGIPGLADRSRERHHMAMMLSASCHVPSSFRTQQGVELQRRHAVLCELSLCWRDGREDGCMMRWKVGRGLRNFTPSAALAGFASGEGEEVGEGVQEVEGLEDSVAGQELYMHSGCEDNGATAELGKVAALADGSGRMQGMAGAFSISSQTAVAITASVGLAAFVFPLFMQSSLAAMGLKTRVLSYATLLCGFYMAWNIGANDVANAMGTSVGSGALSLRQAVVTAAVLEFAGAFLVGSHVSHTMQNGILTAGVFNGRDALLFSGMLSSLAAAGTWLQVASYYGWPVSTTHCIIGAMVGFGLVYGGIGAVYWWSLAKVVSSWVVSPIMGAAVAFLVYKCIRVFVYSAPNPGQAAARAAPLAVFVGVTALLFTALHGPGNPFVAAAKALGCGLLGALAMHTVIQQQIGQLLGEYCELPRSSEEEKKKSQPLSLNLLAEVGGPTGTPLKIVYTIFGYLQVLSACFMSFAHGANDVANAIGPISAALAILHGNVGGHVGMSTEVLAWGGFGIVAGLVVWGYRVIATIGKKITELTPTRGFAAEFAAATVVVFASRMGLPISATHTLVGAVMGVGFARGLKSVRVEVVREIAASWLVTVPVGAILSVAYTFFLIRLVPTLA